MRYQRFAGLAAIVASPFALAGFGAQPAFGAGATAGGTIHIWSAEQGTEESATEPLLITGAIGDYGTTTSEDKNGQTDENGSYEKFTLTQGTFVANATALNSQFSHLKPTLNKTNCGGSFKVSGAVSVGEGTGAYAGMKGTLRITLADAFIQPKDSSGKCNFKADALSGYSTVTGSGYVNF